LLLESREILRVTSANGGNRLDERLAARLDAFLEDGIGKFRGKLTRRRGIAARLALLLRA
jgi:hypothetical protein